MRPIGHLSNRRVLHNDHTLDTSEHQTRHHQKDGSRKQGIADPNRATIGPIIGVITMHEAKDQDRQRHREAQDQMDQEHVQIKPILKHLPGRSLEDGNADQIKGINNQEREKPLNQREKLRQSGADRLAEAWLRALPLAWAGR